MEHAEMIKEQAAEYRASEAQAADSPNYISSETWEAVKLASIAGVSDVDLSAKFQISRDTIRSKRFRDPMWKAAFEARQLVNTDKGTGATEAQQIAQKAASSIAENIASIGTANRLLALQIASKGLKRADQANLEVENWQDFKILVDSVAKLTGLEGGNSVQVNVLTDGSAGFDVEDFPVIDADEGGPE